MAFYILSLLLHDCSLFQVLVSCPQSSFVCQQYYCCQLRVAWWPIGTSTESSGSLPPEVSQFTAGKQLNNLRMQTPQLSLSHAGAISPCPAQSQSHLSGTKLFIGSHSQCKWTKMSRTGPITSDKLTNAHSQQYEHCSGLLPGITILVLLDFLASAAEHARWGRRLTRTQEPSRGP